MATNYESGRQLEYRARNYLRDLGYFVVRSAGSKGKADLIAVRPGPVVLLVQAKAGSIENRERLEARELGKLARDLGCAAWMVGKDDRGKMVWLNVDVNTAAMVESTP